jgi:sec-independent protein translocase protein TatB
MFDISLSELLVIAIVAIIFIGPKELPMVLYNLARGIGKLRRMAEEFRQQFMDQMRESGYEDLHKDMQALRGLNPVNQLRDSFDDLVRKAASTPPAAAAAAAAAPAASSEPAAPAEAAPASPPAADAADVKSQPANENKKPAAV